jgi:hypothetical protein
MDIKFDSEYFENATELAQAREDAWENVKDRRDRLGIVRKFTNMMNTLSEEEAKQLNRTEIVNHGLTHRDMLQNETQLTSMVTVTNSLLEIIVDTDNPEQDLVTSQRMSQAINENAIHHKGRFANLWRKVAGEIVIAGGCPVVFPQKYGWLPTPSPDMYFPRNTSLDAEEIPYAFQSIELGVMDLKNLREAVEGEKGKHISVYNIDKLIEAIEDQIKENNKKSSNEFEVAQSVRENDLFDRQITISACWYYEIKTKEKSSDQYVSATLFIDNIEGIELKSKSEDASAHCIVAYFDKAYENASDWLHMVTVDSEIGGVKTTDTLRGVAEMSYASGAEMEELLNLIIEGDKARAKPKWKLTDGADPEEVLKWNSVSDAFVPQGIEEMQIRNNSASLMTPFSLLSQNAAGLATSDTANSGRGGELRQQAVERQKNSVMLQTNRVSEAYNHMESILETVVWRLLAGDSKPGTAGYRETMRVREKLEAYGIDYTKLAERKYGKFTWLRIRVKRTIGNGDRQQQLETADWIMANRMALEPIARPLAIQQALLLRTQDPDLAESLVKVPKAVINAQKITAENEYDTIRRRAALGQILPVSQDDIHQDHIPIHLLDMQAHVAAHSVRPWDKLDVISFAGLVEHTGQHLQTLMGDPLTAGEAKLFLQDYQMISESAQAIVAEIDEATPDEGMGMTAKEQADYTLKLEALRQRSVELGLKAENMDRLNKNAASRQALAQRSQYVREINESARLKLDDKRIEKQAAMKKQQQKKND